MDEEPSAAARYRERAAQAREEAEKISSPDIRQTLLTVADDYEKLAARIESRARSKH
jgi:hypothetical protein